MPRKRAGDIGFIRTIKGRKCRFDLWEPLEFGAGISSYLKKKPSVNMVALLELKEDGHTKH